MRPSRPSAAAARGTDQDHAADPARGIGARLAAHRAARGIRASALARDIGVSASLISQLERGQSRPSVSTLFALAQALDVPVDTFFRDADAPAAAAPGVTRPQSPPAVSADPGIVGTPLGDERRAAEHRYVVRRDERAAIDIDGGVRWERLMPRPLDEVEFLELVYAPGAESHPALYRHAGTELVLVLAGRLQIFVGFERFELAQGDSICFPSTEPHRYRNPTQETTRAVSVILSDEGIDAPRHDNRRHP